MLIAKTKFLQKIMTLQKRKFKRKIMLAHKNQFEKKDHITPLIFGSRLRFLGFNEILSLIFQKISSNFSKILWHLIEIFPSQSTRKFLKVMKLEEFSTIFWFFMLRNTLSYNKIVLKHFFVIKSKAFLFV